MPNTEDILLKEIAEETERWLVINIPSEFHTIIVAENWQLDPNDPQSVVPIQQHIIGYFGDQNISLRLEIYKAGKRFPPTRHLFDTETCIEIGSRTCKWITTGSTTGWKIKSYYLRNLNFIELSFVLSINSITIPSPQIATRHT